jgi:hypothetical protein
MKGIVTDRDVDCKSHFRAECGDPSAAHTLANRTQSWLSDRPQPPTRRWSAALRRKKPILFEPPCRQTKPPTVTNREPQEPKNAAMRTNNAGEWQSAWIPTPRKTRSPGRDEQFCFHNPERSAAPRALSCHATLSSDEWRNSILSSLVTMIEASCCIGL